MLPLRPDPNAARDLQVRSLVRASIAHGIAALDRGTTRARYAAKPWLSLVLAAGALISTPIKLAFVLRDLLRERRWHKRHPESVRPPPTAREEINEIYFELFPYVANAIGGYVLVAVALTVHNDRFPDLVFGLFAGGVLLWMLLIG